MSYYSNILTVYPMATQMARTAGVSGAAPLGTRFPRNIIASYGAIVKSLPNSVLRGREGN